MKRSHGTRPLRQRFQTAIGGSPRLRRRCRGLTLGTEPLERRDVFAASLALIGPPTVVFEGENAAFTLRLSEPVKTTERVFITTAPGTATYGSDYFAPVSTQILFSPGQTTKTFSIPTLRDAGGPKVEGLETFRVIATPVNAAFGTRSAIVTIADYTPPPTISVDDIRITEGNSGTKTATFTVGLSQAHAKPVTVAFATRDGTATVANADYVSTSGILTFAPGELTKSVGVTINGDQILEPDETFTLVLSAPTEATLAKATGTCTIVNDEQDQPGFQISLTYGTPNLPAAQRGVFERAVTRIQQIVVGDVPGVTAPDGTFVDDIRITAYVEAMDLGFNGYATATAFRSGAAGLPYAGEIHLNSAYIGNPGIYYTAIHEMLHALGFYDTFFSATNTVSGLGTTAPLFTGANAVREYKSYFSLASSTGVPLYGNLAAAGSYGSHWDTATIGTEIMSVGWDTTSTSVRPFSRMTIGALDDIGYDVNYAAADAYTRPSDAVVAQLAAATTVATVSATSNTTTSSVATPMKQAVLARPAVLLVEPTAVKFVPAVQNGATQPGKTAGTAVTVAKAVATKITIDATKISTAGIR